MFLPNLELKVFVNLMILEDLGPFEPHKAQRPQKNYRIVQVLMRFTNLEIHFLSKVYSR